MTEKTEDGRQKMEEGNAPSRKSRKRRGWRAIVVLLSLLVVAEILLRILFGFGNPVLTLRDPDCGYRVKPDQRVYRFFRHNDINHYGMRSPEITLARPKDALRYFFVGDSVTYGTTFVDQSEIFTSRLANLLPDMERQSVEVLNQSAGGWGPPNETRYLLANGTFDSNVVLFVLNTGDLGEKYGGFPEGDLNFPTARPVTAISEIINRYLIPRIKGQIFRDAGTTIPNPQQLAEAQIVNLQLLAQASDFAHRSQALFVIVYVPFAGLAKSDIEAAESALAQWTSDQHIPFLDIAPALAREDPKLMTFDGLHLRSRGDEVVANEIAHQWPIVDAALKTFVANRAATTESK